MGPLDDKVALVTGASGGIGRQIAVRLAESGARVIAHYSSRRESAEQTVAAVQAVGGEAAILQADLSHGDGVRQLFAGVDELGGRIDILVNNAGAGETSPIGTIKEEEIDRMYRVNFKSPVLVTQQALTRMSDGGAIVNISSMSGLMAQPPGFAYAMSKAAIHSFTLSMAVELAARNIRVNAVAPGPVDTDLINGYRASDDAMRALSSMAALGRLGTPDDIAQIVLFLASPASAWLTGQIIQASGGMRL
ncbi:SDR family NAD(P)-dependent oxidoreductase [Sphingobium vermicomposti]|uniref:NAD(P)-dependent dehydrogenase (Short-subunit alcohol dehydrogenase family) n=1 Tax=Sphingobium vermicomposti TaxID=529005 RepID=A0A846MAH3_9SPHN|nr:glucose 1-dehydrogenase [Sphingobium vermicomposti]NIJ17811.1 NAD(P)-dependent dehydrogenase (short-subunit alcohol dehydrogenase family) [Sphingobium vermicomposti]